MPYAAYTVTRVLLFTFLCQACWWVSHFYISRELSGLGGVGTCAPMVIGWCESARTPTLLAAPKHAHQTCAQSTLSRGLVSCA